jgi:hypothetical protein
MKPAWNVADRSISNGPENRSIFTAGPAQNNIPETNTKT